MGDVTKIEWCDYTFNPWVGCSKVHAGCANCYAEADFDKRRHFAQWGPHGTRVKTSAANWAKPPKWNRRDHRCMNCGKLCFREGVHPNEVRSQCCNANAVPVRPRVFCASLADVFEDWDGPVYDSKGNVLFRSDGGRVGPMAAHHSHERIVQLTMANLRRELFALIDATPNLDWLLLTKRPQNIRRMWVDEKIPWRATGQWHRDNVYLLTSISDQPTADAMIPELLKCRDLARVLGVSLEPQLGPIDITWWVNQGLGWVIVGGESGPGARPCQVGWIRSIVEQCRVADVRCFVKQLGAEPRPSALPCDVRVRAIRDKKGGNPQEWPEDLRVREFPRIESEA